MRKLYIFGLIAVALLVIGIAIADEIKFSTYYPAPAGMYREFSTTGKTTLATDEFGIETDARVGIGTTDPGTAKLAVIGGNVGIGTTSPGAKLDVAGTAKIANWAEQSLAANGYAKIGSLLIQWGHEANAGAKTFPVAFPEACFGVSITAEANTYNFVTAYSTTGFTAATGGADYPFFWIAIGN